MSSTFFSVTVYVAECVTAVVAAEGSWYGTVWIGDDLGIWICAGSGISFGIYDCGIGSYVGYVSGSGFCDSSFSPRWGSHPFCRLPWSQS